MCGGAGGHLISIPHLFGQNQYILKTRSLISSHFIGQFTDVFTKTEHNQVTLLDRSVPFFEEIIVPKKGVTKLLKGLNPYKALGPGELLLLFPVEVQKRLIQHFHTVD